MKIVEGKNLVKHYQIDLDNYVKAINGINISIDISEFICIMGPSGGGKSTLLNILSTIDLPTRGKITIDEQNIKLLSEDKLCRFRYEHLGFVFQDLQVLNDYSIYDNISIPLVMAGVKKEIIKENVTEVTKKLGIEKLLDKKPNHCSGGELQRVAIARALVTNPKLIVADEPTGNLDANTTDELLDLFQSFYQEGNTIIMVTHDCYVASFASRVVYLKDGMLDAELVRGTLSQKAFFDQIVDLNAKELMKENQINQMYEESEIRIKKDNKTKTKEAKLLDIFMGERIVYLITLKNKKNINFELLNELGEYNLVSEKTIRITSSIPANKIKDYLLETYGLEDQDYSLINTRFPMYKY